MVGISIDVVNGGVAVIVKVPGMNSEVSAIPCVMPARTTSQSIGKCMADLERMRRVFHKPGEEVITLTSAKEWGRTRMRYKA